MFTPTQAAPASYPRQAAFAGCAMVATQSRNPRPRYPKGRSMAAMLAATGMAAPLAWLRLQAAYAAHVAGKPLAWPQG